MKNKLIIPLLALIFVGCASFVNDSQRSIYVAANLADGSMKGFAVYWKDQTNRQGATPQLLAQQTNVIALAGKVGAGLQLADKTLADYQANIGTNAATKAVVQAVIQTALGDVTELAAFVGSITGNTNLTTVP